MTDETVRKSWLVLLFTSTLFSIVTLFLMKSSQQNILPEKMQFFIQCGQVLLALAFNASFYYCAYRKQGTKFLLFSLVLTGISPFFNAFLYLTGRMDGALAAIPYYGWVIVVSQLLGVLWFIFCWKMRKINLKWRKV